MGQSDVVHLTQVVLVQFFALLDDYLIALSLDVKELAKEKKRGCVCFAEQSGRKREGKVTFSTLR